MLGRKVDTVEETFDLGATIAVPIYDRAAIDSEAIRAEAELRARDAELEDLRATIYYEVRSALLDLDAARELTAVGRAGLDLASRQLEQARDRFAAGVARTSRWSRRRSRLPAPTRPSSRACTC